jgi:dTDP-4-amino-4,6-dideoxygalactose transaminase
LGLTNGKNVYVKVFTSATGVLEVALRAMGIGPGDEVIVPSMTFAASANVVKLCGATPVIVDVDFETRNINLEIIQRAVTPRTKAIMPVHFAGLSVDMDPILKFAKEKNIRIIEDAAHAIGTSYKGKKIGSFGDMISFSFHPNKNMTTIEGGALVLFNQKEAEQVDLYRFHGLKRDALGNMDVLFPSGKFNLTDVAAAVGIGQIKRLDEFNAKRKVLVKRYFERLAGVANIVLPHKGDEGHAWHMFAPLIDFQKIGMTRPEFIKKMAEHKINVGVHYQALHNFTAYKQHQLKGETYKAANRIGEGTVTLPLFSQMTVSDVDRVCDALTLTIK